MQTIKRQQTSLLHLLAMVLAALLLLTACKSKVERVQEQLDLGQRYLQELNYTEAILAFTQAIEIDPRQAEAYAGRADAYMGLYESGGEENLQLAQADYEEALRQLDHQGHSWKLSQYASNALCEDVKKIIRLSGSEGKA